MAIRVALIGAGAVASLHIEAIRKLGDVDVVAIAEMDAEFAAERAAQLHVGRACGSYGEILTDPGIDAVHICVPNYLHREVITAALRAGKHVLAEKPLGMTTTECQELVGLAKASGLVTAVNFHYRYHASVLQIRDLIASGGLGDIRVAYGSYLQDWMLYETDYNWRVDPALGGRSRVVADIGSHWFDLIEYVLGQRIVRLFADVRTLLPHRLKGKSDLEAEKVPVITEDYATVLFELSGGCVGTVTLSQVSPGRKNRLYFEIDGSQSAVAWDWENPNELWIGSRQGPNHTTLRVGDFMTGWREGINRLIANFYAAIQAGQGTGSGHVHDCPTFADGLRTCALVEAVLESSAQGHWVDICPEYVPE